MWWSQWLTDKDHTGRADVIGAATTTLIVASGVIVYTKREGLNGVFGWIATHPVRSTVIAAPFAGFALICLSKFATFIGASLTTVGLLIALDNNRKSHHRETKKFSRQEMAARTALTHELSAICEYAEAVVQTYLNVHELTEEDREQFALQPVTFPDFPTTASATIKEMITSTDNKAVAHRCAQLQRYLQIIRTNLRLKSKVSDFSEPDDRTQLMRAVILYGIATSLIGFAREDDPEPAHLEWDNIDTYATFLGLAENAEFQAYLYRAFKQSDDPIHFNSHRLNSKNE